ncbi:MAG: preprotein translocase subunit SecG [Bacteroidota bacterium]|nr:preprotein translocase subunit SecG [Bacteroidota bacterium]
MFTFIISIIIILSLLLILVVLAQNSKGGGLSSQFGGSSTSQLMGVKKTGDILEKLTWGFAIGILALSLSTSAFTRTTAAGPSSPNVDRAREQTIMPGLSPIEDGTGTTTEDPGTTTEQPGLSPSPGQEVPEENQ